MDAIECIKTRRSIRTYTSQPVDKKIIEEIVDCARLAPTANNLQPWEFIVITEKATRERIADLTDYGKFISSAPVCIAVFCKDTKYYLEDGSAATENILLAAHALGLGACWVAGDKKRYAEEIRKLLSVPSGYKLVSLISLGYSSSGKVPSYAYSATKRPLREVLHWEKF